MPDLFLQPAQSVVAQRQGRPSIRVTDGLSSASLRRISNSSVLEGERLGGPEKSPTSARLIARRLRNANDGWVFLDQFAPDLRATSRCKSNPSVFPGPFLCDSGVVEAVGEIALKLGVSRPSLDQLLDRERLRERSIARDLPWGRSWTTSAGPRSPFRMTPSGRRRIRQAHLEESNALKAGRQGSAYSGDCGVFLGQFTSDGQPGLCRGEASPAGKRSRHATDGVIAIAQDFAGRDRLRRLPLRAFPSNCRDSSKAESASASAGRLH